MHHFRKLSDAYESVKTGEEPDAPVHLVSPFFFLNLFLFLFTVPTSLLAVQLSQTQKRSSGIRTLGRVLLGQHGLPRIATPID